MKCWTGLFGKMMPGMRVDKDTTEKQSMRVLKRSVKLSETTANEPGKNGMVGSPMAETETSGAYRVQSPVQACRTGWATVAGRTDPYPCPCGDWSRQRRLSSHRESGAAPPPPLHGQEEELGDCGFALRGVLGAAMGARGA